MDQSSIIRLILREIATLSGRPEEVFSGYFSAVGDMSSSERGIVGKMRSALSQGDLGLVPRIIHMADTASVGIDFKRAFNNRTVRERPSLRRKGVLSETDIEEAWESPHYLERVTGRIHEFMPSREKTIEVLDRLKKLKKVEFPETLSFLVKIADLDKVMRYSDPETRRESRGDQVRAIVRKNTINTVMFRMSSQTADKELNKISMKVNDVIDISDERDLAKIKNLKALDSLGMRRTASF